MAALQSTSAEQGENRTFSPLESGCTAQGIATQKVLGRVGRRSSAPATHHGVGEFAFDEEENLSVALAKADSAQRPVRGTPALSGS